MTAIRVENLGKSYRIGKDQSKRGYKTLRESVTDMLSAPLRHLRSGAALGHTEEFWALKDINFEVEPGEVVGIIGHNGAGKSTLLKILTGITAPTTGRVELHGRVGSLLEVGTGFYPELTGRENIYLNGSILGMKHSEVQTLFDDIVDFSGIGEFLDTPVKRYSSGMRVRLAFSVAAFLKPEILIIDEVLAVGDASFQDKCLGKMNEVANSGRTVLFVSHNMASIQRLCKTGILLSKGQLKEQGSVDYVTKRYLESEAKLSGTASWNRDSTSGDNIARLLSARILDSTDQEIGIAQITDDISLEITYLQNLADVKVSALFYVINEQHVCLFSSCDFVNQGWWDKTRRPGVVTSSCRIPGNFLAEGNLSFHVAICSYDPYRVHDRVNFALNLQIVDRTTGEGARGYHSGKWSGVVRPLLDWSVDHTTALSEDLGKLKATSDGK